MEGFACVTVYFLKLLHLLIYEFLPGTVYVLRVYGQVRSNVYSTVFLQNYVVFFSILIFSTQIIFFAKLFLV
jgi:hypothetical protein